jgi:hypothetical protein
MYSAAGRRRNSRSSWNRCATLTSAPRSGRAGESGEQSARLARRSTPSPQENLETHPLTIPAIAIVKAVRALIDQDLNLLAGGPRGPGGPHGPGGRQGSDELKDEILSVRSSWPCRRERRAKRASRPSQHPFAAVREVPEVRTVREVDKARMDRVGIAIAGMVRG